MAASKTKSRTPDVDRDALLDTALTLIGAQGWRRFGLQALATEAGVPVARVAELFPDRVAVLEAVVDRTDGLMLADVTAADETEPHRDRLFDLMMRRLDALAPHKAAIAAIGKAVPCDPELGLRLGWRLRGALRRTLEAAGISTAGLRGLARVKALGILGIWVMRTWLEDDSPDMGPTMKALDTALDRAEAMERTLTKVVPFAGPGTTPRSASTDPHDASPEAEDPDGAAPSRL